MTENYYRILGVAPDSEDIVIRAAYRAMMLKYHPDQNQGEPGKAEAKAKAINHAYAVLIDPSKRAEYDLSRMRKRSTKKTGQQGSKSGEARTEPGKSDSSSPAPPHSPHEEPRSTDANTPPGSGWGHALFLYVFIALFICVVVGMSVMRGSEEGLSGSIFEPAQVTAAEATSVTPVDFNQPVHWSAEGGKDPQKFAVGNLTITMRSGVKSGRGGVNPVPIATFEKPGLPPLERQGAEGFSNAAANLITAELEKGVPATLLMTFSGGAHCCTQIEIVKGTSKGWVVIDGGGWDGEPLAGPLKDLNGDGRLDLELADDRFSYVFAPYALSIKPPRVFNLLGDKLIDVSKTATFASVFREAMVEAQEGCAAHNNGACAAYVASAARIGLYDWAWNNMLASYDRVVDPMWMPATCSSAKVNGACPKGSEVVFEDFPHALDWFLAETDYAKPQFVLPTSGPSFECKEAQSPVLNLICVSKMLSALDRQLSAAYAAALASASDPAALKAAQLVWLRERDISAPNELAIAQLYRNRIASLSAAGPR